MGAFLTTSGQIACPHGAVAPVASLAGIVSCQINSANTLTEANVGAVAFGCPKESPCVAVTSWVANQSVFRINGKSVLTSDSVPMTNNGPGSVVDPGQAKANVTV